MPSKKKWSSLDGAATASVESATTKKKEKKKTSGLELHGSICQIGWRARSQTPLIDRQRQLSLCWDVACSHLRMKRNWTREEEEEKELSALVVIERRRFHNEAGREWGTYVELSTTKSAKVPCAYINVMTLPAGLLLRQLPQERIECRKVLCTEKNSCSHPLRHRI